VRTEHPARRIAVHLAAEAVQVGRAAGHEAEPIYGIPAQRFVDAAQGLGLEEVERDLAADAASRGAGRPSLLQDVMKRRRTEIDALSGLVAREGRRLGVKTPLTDAVLAEYRRHGPGLTPDPVNLEPLARRVPA
jgi:2-dehydropantoate 2-reductase